jgi:hypothetical protein
MSATQYLVDASTRHQVFLQRYAAGRSKEAIATLSRLRRDINARLSQEPTVFQRNRLVAVLEDIEKLSVQAFGTIKQKVKLDAMELVSNEAEFSVNLYNKVSTATFVLPAESVLLAAVESAPMGGPLIGSKTIDESLRQFGTKKSKQIMQAITDGLVLGDTTPTISQKVGTLINTLQRRQLDTLVRTVANSTSSMARTATYDANSDIIDGYTFVATLDSSTTLTCAEHDQEFVPNGMPGPKPSLHYGCRSTTTPRVKPEYSLAAGLKGERPSIGADGVEAVGSKTTYGGWLKKQPAAFVDEALGPERSKLFRSGAIKIGGFTDPTGRVYTLKELRGMNPIAFQEA